MHFINAEILEKINSLPLDTREKVLNGLIKMLAERPKGLEKDSQNEEMRIQTEIVN